MQVFLAARGYTRVYAVSSSRIFENYGKGIALAYEAGVDLVDMVMVQFHPTGMAWPEKAVGTLATEAIRGEGGILLNSKGERFMKIYDPERMQLGPRDVVAMQKSGMITITPAMGGKHVVNCRFFDQSTIVEHMSKTWNIVTIFRYEKFSL